MTKRITLKAIDTKLAMFVTNRDALRQLGHEIGLMIFMHAAPAEVSPDCNATGDCTRAIALVKEMPKSWQPQMELWFKLFTPIRVVSKNDKCEYDPKYKKLSPEEKLAWWKIVDANENPFWTVMGEPEVKTFSFEDLLKLIPGLAKRIEKQIDEHKIKDEDVASAKAMADQLKVLTFKRVKADKPDNDAAAAMAAAAA
jgi:hypothetical protein